MLSSAGEITRRHFLWASLAAAAANNTAVHARGTDRRLKIAVKLHMVRGALTVDEKFRLVKDAGFDGLEVDVRDRGAVDELIAASTRYRLPIHGVVNASRPDPAEAITFAHRLGADSVLIVVGQDPEKSYKDNFAYWQKLLTTVLPLAERLQIRLLIENVRATFLKTAEDMAGFIDSFESEFVGAYYDTGNTITWTEQSAEHWAHVLGRRIQKIDIKDRGHAEFGDVRLASKTAVGTHGGEVHWDNVRRKLDAVSFAGWTTAEVTGGDARRLRGIAQWMRSVLEIEQ